MSARSTLLPVAVALATVGELDRSRRLRPDAERRAARIAARRAIRRLAGERAAVEIRHRRAGAPRVRLRGAGAGTVALSLAHRDGRTAAIAAPAGTGVGIDIERLDGVYPGHERLFLTPRERDGAGPCAAPLWALKEAAWKALALDASVGFHELELEVGGGGELRALAFRGRRHRAVAALASPWPGYVMATVVLEERR
jgi:phosphopantetheinyl transferase (holo-ACP synthase)